MGMTATQKILARHAGLGNVRPGELITAYADLALGNDITAPVAIDEFYAAGFERVRDREKIAIVLDHFTPAKDIKAAQLCKKCRAFAAKQELTHFYEAGEAGIEHALLPEIGLVAPGELIIGADSHTCTYGAAGAFAAGFGSTDLAAAMAKGIVWLKTPSAIRVVFRGAPPRFVCGKDAALHIVAALGTDGALYKSLEFGGPGLRHLSMDDRFTIANMSVECGAKNGLFDVDDTTLAYLADRVKRPWQAETADGDAQYDATLDIDLSALRPLVALPFSPAKAVPAARAGDISIDQAVIGSCTNGRYGDMLAATEIFKGRKAAKGVRVIIIPATAAIYRKAMREGLLDIFLDAGCVISPPTCGPCLGGHMGVLAEGERCVATTNRNFVGRMGHPKSEVYLASPCVAAASAVAGRICDPAALMGG
ncbi:MAG: 3-isopropylmalate dehydratase large subunit [Oscillospiraceae bacterium]|jgi:3-isopropylmalate/(R)-2-methylmalate dehydratase large subunit|nr:3-isopropylmalate dehydratase large subunit [Oscillospiraceae bacterium]